MREFEMIIAFATLGLGNVLGEDFLSGGQYD